ncbi:helix-turn-helix domain-containing protein [Streptomyces albidochromogenes]|uniref:helix-turn-helix domain-containing protein n=1 Tax=Streptomyces albidochromogenes TaxID=329524 RepID=UPI003CD0B85B
METAPAATLPSPKERRRLREAKSLTQEQVAATLGITRETLRAWESGRVNPKRRKRAAYAKLLASFRDDTTEVLAGRTAAEEAPRLGTDADTEAEAEAAAGSDTDTDADADTARPVPEAEPEPTGPRTSTSTSTSTSTEPPPAKLTPAQAFDALYGHCATALLSQTFLLTGNRKLARESVEYAFRLAWERWPAVATDRDPAGWVRAAAYEYALSPWHRLRRVRRRQERPPADRDRRVLLQALLALPPAHRRTLLLYDGLGLGLPDTAAETEASTPATANRLLRARAAIAHRLPEFADAGTPAEQSALLRDRLGHLAEMVTAPPVKLPPARAVRAGSERRNRFWTRAALFFTAMIVSATGFTLVTAPTRYEPPQAPGEPVRGVPMRAGPQPLTPQDEELRGLLHEAPVTGPPRLVPEAR